MRECIRYAALGCAMVVGGGASAQNSGTAPESIFHPIDWPDHGEVRLASGAPGPAYWQQRADYEIDVLLDVEQAQLDGELACTYTNNSPHELTYLWLNLEQNAFRPDSIGTRSMMPDLWWRVPPDFMGGFDLRELAVGGEGVESVVYDAMARVDLAEPLMPGESVVLTLEFSMPIPPRGRLGMFESEAGTVYQLAHWFPNVAVYDDVHGWNVLPHQGDGEFYTNFGDYEVNITVPADHVVAATGVLTNADEVLSAEGRERLERAMGSTEVVRIRAFEDIPEYEASETKTWRFTAEDVRAFAFASSRAFAWDAAIAAEDRPVLCQTFYPPEAAPLWSDEAIRFGQHSINFYSEWLMEYPYPTATNVNGIVGGMEYPMIVFCAEQNHYEGLFGVTDHEFGHMWYPMIVNTDERRHAWMDEGFNTFINYYSAAKYLNHPLRGSDIYSMLSDGIASEPAPPVMTYPDQMRAGTLGFLAYGKPGYTMQVLREYVLGPERFDFAFREYTRRWAFKSPRPVDFFRTMEDAAGADLTWFWRGWFMESAHLDQAVTDVSWAPRRGEVGLVIENRGRMVMPVKMRVEYADGSEELREIPAEAWARTDTFPVRWDSGGRSIRKVTLDPDQWLPDLDRSNNIFEAPAGEEMEEELDPRDMRNVPSTRGGSRKKSASSQTLEE